MRVFQGFWLFRKRLDGKEKYAPVYNYYGSPMVWMSRGGKRFFSLESWDGIMTVEVSEKFYDTFINEFKDYEEAE